MSWINGSVHTAGSGSTVRVTHVGSAPFTGRRSVSQLMTRTSSPGKLHV